MMNSIVSIISLIISFLYGILFFYLIKLNNYFTIKMNYLIKEFITVLCIIDIVILYVIILFGINKGYFHIYFILMVIVGYIISYYINSKYL